MRPERRRGYLLGKKATPLGALEGTRKEVGTPRHACIIAPSHLRPTPFVCTDTSVP